MSRLAWRWEERDFGFRFRGSSGKADEFYQAGTPGEFYVVPKGQRKLSKSEIDRLAAAATAPSGPRVVANPWDNYQHSDWDEIVALGGGICINWAGCLDPEEIKRREDEGVQRAQELIVGKAMLSEPAPITIDLIQRIHTELMGNIYPFAGRWRNVALAKGNAHWPFPPGGIQPQMDVFARDVLARTPFQSEINDEVFEFMAKLMMELIAIHPFREGNGRTAFIVGDLLLMQNGLLPLTDWRKADESRYFAACDAGRLQCMYSPMADLLREWEGEALSKWEAEHG
jgi:cell filamentation protein